MLRVGLTLCFVQKPSLSLFITLKRNVARTLKPRSFYQRVKKQRLNSGGVTEIAVMTRCRVRAVDESE